MLRNAVGGGWVSAFPEKSVTKVYGSTLLALSLPEIPKIIVCRAPPLQPAASRLGVATLHYAPSASRPFHEISREVDQLLGLPTPYSINTNRVECLCLNQLN